MDAFIIGQAKDLTVAKDFSMWVTWWREWVLGYRARGGVEDNKPTGPVVDQVWGQMGAPKPQNVVDRVRTVRHPPNTKPATKKSYSKCTMEYSSVVSRNSWVTVLWQKVANSRLSFYSRQRECQPASVGGNLSLLATAVSSTFTLSDAPQGAVFPTWFQMLPARSSLRLCGTIWECRSDRFSGPCSNSKPKRS